MTRIWSDVALLFFGSLAVIVGVALVMTGHVVGVLPALAGVTPALAAVFDLRSIVSGRR